MSTVSKLRVRVVDDGIRNAPGVKIFGNLLQAENSAQLLAKAIPDTDDLRIAMTVSKFLAKAWRPANDKAKEVGWII